MIAVERTSIGRMCNTSSTWQAAVRRILLVFFSFRFWYQHTPLLPYLNIKKRARVFKNTIYMPSRDMTPSAYRASASRLVRCTPEPSNRSNRRCTP